MLCAEPAVRPILLAFLIGMTSLAAGEDPFAPPPELQVFVRKHTLNQISTSGKAGSILRAFFAPVEEGGLGMVYDDEYTRTVKEAWRDRKANCLSLTALYIAACKSINLEARFGESLRISRWRRVGTTIRYERHVVAVVPSGNIGQELIADFLPEMRRGSQMVAILDQKRVLALFHSNRAVEMLEGLRPAEALAEARLSIEVDPSSGVGWNILGVVQREQGQDKEAEVSFRKALEVDPRDGSACGNMETLLRAEGRIEEAQVYRERGLEVRKHDPYFNAFLAEEALTNSDWGEASKRIKMAIHLLPQEPDFHLLQARIFLAEGKTKNAIKSLENAKRWAGPEEQTRFDTKISLLKGKQD
jgi:Tfp pilus assembly protein PilF